MTGAMNADTHACTQSRRNHSFRDAWIVETTTGPIKGHAETGVVASAEFRTRNRRAVTCDFGVLNRWNRGRNR